MRVNIILVLCAHACFLQSAIGQCFGRAGIGAPGLAGSGLAGSGLVGSALGANCGVGSTGGGFPVTSASPVPPTGLTVVSETLYEGGLFVEGNLPLLGSVGLEGTMGTAGAGAVSYGCGDSVGIAVEEGPIVTGIVPSAVGPGAVGPGAVGPGVVGPGAVGPGVVGLGIAGRAYGTGLAYSAGPGCRNGAIY